MSDIIKKLSEEMPEMAIQRTRKEDTKKAYDTDGYSYQYCVNRFNDICGKKWGYEWEIINEERGQYKGGMPFIDITVKMFIWVNDSNKVRSNVGGHKAINYADALKGAITNAYKKTAAFWGVGRAAYAGTIDDDNKPSPDYDKNIEKIEKVEKEFNGKVISSDYEPKPMSAEEAEKRFSELPEKVTIFFEDKGYDKAQRFDFCKRHEWVHEKMIETVNRQ